MSNTSIGRTGAAGSCGGERFRSCLTQEDSYVLGCYRYIELNPVCAGMVEHPGEYRWSSYLAEALSLRSVGTFIELLIGAMLTPEGFVTEAYLVVTMRNHWSSVGYHVIIFQKGAIFCSEPARY